MHLHGSLITVSQGVPTIYLSTYIRQWNPHCSTFRSRRVPTTYITDTISHDIHTVRRVVSRRAD